jgi:hypothetical protein
MSTEINSSPGEQQPIKRTGSTGRPALPKRLFWDMCFDEIDWLGDNVTIIGRVMERGNESEVVELIRFYGVDKVLQILKVETPYLPDHTITRVCNYFKLKPEELRCYTRPWWRKGHWP